MKGMNVQKCTLCVCVLTLILVCVLVFRNVNEGFVNIHSTSNCTQWNKFNTTRNGMFRHLNHLVIRWEEARNDFESTKKKAERARMTGLENEIRRRITELQGITDRLNELFLLENSKSTPNTGNMKELKLGALHNHPITTAKNFLRASTKIETDFRSNGK